MDQAAGILSRARAGTLTAGEARHFLLEAVGFRPSSGQPLDVASGRAELHDLDPYRPAGQNYVTVTF